MAQQFDLVENLDPVGRGQYPFLLVAPLVRVNPALARTRFHPQVVLQGQQYLVFVEDLAAIPRGALGRVVGSAEADRYAIVGALDLLFTGI